MSASYLRCSHCRGFYETARAHCRYCGKDVPVKDGKGAAKVFVDRETCRAIQIAEYEQLPAEAHKDCFQPDSEVLDKLCGCLHCGREGGLFEAVEMRWMVNEKMWACPCTTCGGRGFGFDVHLAEPLWQCAECKHYYAPADGNFRSSNAKCPKCGSTCANGWFDDEEEEGEELVMDEEGGEEGEMEFAVGDDELPWEEGEVAEQFSGEVPEVWAELEKMQDDIDFPREPRDVFGGEGGGEPLGEDDIPW